MHVTTEVDETISSIPPQLDVTTALLNSGHVEPPILLGAHPLKLSDVIFPFVREIEELLQVPPLLLIIIPVIVRSANPVFFTIMMPSVPVTYILSMSMLAVLHARARADDDVTFEVVVLV